MVALNKTYRKTLTPDRSAKDSGLRYYSPEISRWLSRDPIEEKMKVRMPRLISRLLANQYRFVDNDPQNQTDAFGLYGNPVPPVVTAPPGVGWKCWRCGPDVTQWLNGQMVNNAASQTTQDIASHNTKANLWPLLGGVWGVYHKGSAYAEWSAMVGYGKPWDFKSKMFNATATCADGPCPEQPCKGYVTLCGKCYRFDVVANIHYGYVGRVAMFTLNELLTGASVAQVFATLSFDPPEDAAAIKAGWHAFTQGLCGAVGSYDGQLAKEEACKTCPAQYTP